MADIQRSESEDLKDFQLSSNTASKEVISEPQNRIQIEIGDSKQVDFKPQVKVMRWDNEVNFSMRAVEHPDAIVQTQGDLIKYETPKYEVHLYEKPEVSENGGFEFEWLLKEKPDTNVLTTTIQSKGLDFFYQPALTQEQIDGGTERPEKAVGSYAVYHSTKGGMDVSGGMKYKTGKAFHIYRPEAEDANGVKTWCDLNIDKENGILSVTVPQKFLDNAVYPVIVDPTFGWTSIGATTQTTEDQIRTGRFAISEDGTGTSLTAFLALTISAKNYKGNVYDDGSGEADTEVDLIANGATEEKEVATGNSQEITFNYTSSPSFTSGTFYRLAIWSFSGTGNGTVYSDEAVAGADAYRDAVTYGTWPSPATVTAENEIRLSIYTTYTAAGGGSLIKTVNGLAIASVKTYNGLAIASVKTMNGLTNV